MNGLSIQPRLKKATVTGFLVSGFYLLYSLSFAQVTNLDDAGAGSLRDVIAAAVDGDTITFQAGLSGTINLTGGEILIDENDLTIDAAGTTITLDGQNTHRIFNHTGTGTFTVNNLTFQNGNDGGNSGGAIRSANNLVVTNSTFRDNTSTIDVFPRGGGALYAEANITVENSTLTNNTAVRGGAMISSFGGGIAITSSTISNNTATRFGGGIYGYVGVTITDSFILNNQADRRGGGVFSNLGGATIDNSTLYGNSSSDDGGGIYSFRNIIMSSSTVYGNSALDSGGGIYGDAGITLTNSAVFGNSATNDGGGIFSDIAITLTNSTVSGNSGGSGGGIFSDDAATLNNSLVLGNSALADAQLSAVGAITLNSSAYGFATGESTGDVFVGRDVNDVFVSPRSAASAPTTLGNYSLVIGSPAIDAGDDGLVPGGITTDLAGNPRIDGAAVDMGAFEGAFPAPPSAINPNQDIQIRNGVTTAAEVITSNGVEVLSYGPFNRGQNVVLEYLVRNPGARTLELGELILPSFLSLSGDVLPSTLASFDSALLELAVDTSQAGVLSGQVSLASNDPDANENPFIFNLIVRVGNEPANAIYVLPGIELEDTTIIPNQQNVPVYSAYLLVPEGSADVTINSLTLNTNDIPALRDVQSLTLLIDGGTRGIQDNRDVVLATIDNPITNTISFEFEERTLQPNLPLWILVVADF